MSRTAPCAFTTLDSIKRGLVSLRMPRVLEVLDATVRRIEQGEIDGLAALDVILAEELGLGLPSFYTPGERGGSVWDGGRFQIEARNAP